MNFKQVKVIAQKDIGTYFYSPIGYIVAIVFFLIANWFFWTGFFIDNVTSMRKFFDYMPIYFIVIIPAITMKSFADEFKTGSYEMLFTLPTNITDIVLGKFFAIIGFMKILFLPTFFIALTVSVLGDFDWGTFIGAFLGTIFMGFTYVSIGVFSSAISKDQIVAFFIGMLISAAITLISYFGYFLPKNLLFIVDFFSTTSHFRNMSKGVIALRDVFYFLGMTAVFLLLTYQVLLHKYLSKK